MASTPSGGVARAEEEGRLSAVNRVAQGRGQHTSLRIWPPESPEIAEVVSEAIRVYAGQHRSPVPLEYVDAATVRRLVAEYVQDHADRGVVHTQVSEAPAPAFASAWC